jgi:hypothetical protein
VARAFRGRGALVGTFARVARDDVAAEALGEMPLAGGLGMFCAPADPLR